MDNNRKNPEKTGSDLRIDEILEEARRRQQGREEEHAAADIDELVAAYHTESSPADEEPEQLTFSAKGDEHKAPKAPERTAQASAKPAPSSGEAKRRLFNPSAFSAAAAKIYHKKERGAGKANTYISPLPEEENESAQLVWSSFAKKVQATQKAEPAESLSWDDVHSDEAASALSGDHLYHLGQDASEDENPPLKERTREIITERFIHADNVIKTEDKTVNFTIQQTDEDDRQEKFIPPAPIKTPKDQVVNNPDPDKMPAKRYIQPPTLKTAPLPAINTPEDFLLGNGEKYIKVPDDYVDPFAEKEFHFGAEGDTVIPKEKGTSEAIAPAEQTQLEGQICLDGFTDPEPVEKIDEAHAEQILMENRREKVHNFRLHEEVKSKIVDFSAPDIAHETAAPVYEKELDFEYRTPNDGARIRDELNTQRSYQALKILGLGIIELLLLWLGVFSQFGTGVPAKLSPVTNPSAFLGVNIFLTLGAALICKNTMVNGIRAILSRKMSSESMLTVSTAAVLLHTLVLTAFPKEVSAGTCKVYTAIAVLSLLFGCCGKFSRLTRIAYNFRFLRSKAPKHAVLTVDDPDDAEELARGAVVGDTSLCYSAPVEFPEDFLALSKKPDRRETLGSAVMPWMLAAAGLVFLITWITQKSFPVALTGFTILTCVLAPLTLLLAGNLPMRSAGKALNARGAMIAGYESVEKFANVNGVMMDAADLFPEGTTQLYGLKIFNGMRIDDAILYGAAVLCEGGGPLASAFRQVIEQREDILPEVENLTYEDGLGLSGWIYDHRVLVGTREMMLHHDVEMPPAVIENKYLQNDPERRALYLTVAGKISAMFVVGYSGSAKIADMLYELEDNGISLLLHTSDPYVTENMVADYFNISPHSVKILSSVGGRMYEEKLHTQRETAPADMIYNGSLRAYAECVLTAIRLKEKINFSMVLQAFGIGLGFLLVGFFSIATGMAQLGPFQLLVYELFWAFVVMLIASLHKL